jgi:hypothetical protein
MPALSPDVVQILVYAGLVLGGYLVRHLNVFRHASPAAPDAPASHPILDRLLPILDEQLNKALEDAARRFVQTPKT